MLVGYYLSFFADSIGFPAINVIKCTTQNAALHSTDKRNIKNTISGHITGDVWEVKITVISIKIILIQSDMQCVSFLKHWNIELKICDQSSFLFT